MTTEEQIERILIEASAYGLRWEVEEFARKEMEKNPNMDKVHAYQTAFDDWVK